MGPVLRNKLHVHGGRAAGLPDLQRVAVHPLHIGTQTGGIGVGIVDHVTGDSLRMDIHPIAQRNRIHGVAGDRATAAALSDARPGQGIGHCVFVTCSDDGGIVTVTAIAVVLHRQGQAVLLVRAGRAFHQGDIHLDVLTGLAQNIDVGQPTRTIIVAISEDAQCIVVI